MPFYQPELPLGLLLITVVASAATACKTGDAPCICETVFMGKWLANPTTLRPLCRKTLTHEGLQRLVDIYLPGNFNLRKRYTPWIYLHGVHAAEWYTADNPEWQTLKRTWGIPQAGNAQVSDLGLISGSPILASASKSSRTGSFKIEDAILVVPEATGSVQKGQIWNSLFWRCVSAINRCVSKDTDDVGYIAYLIDNLGSKVLPGATLNKPYLTGYSNGGMLLQALLCKRPDITKQLSGIGTLASALGKDFAASACQQPLPASVSILWVHGTADTTLPYAAASTEGVQTLGTEETVKLWASRIGCPADATTHPKTIFEDVKHGVVCKDYCTKAPQQQRQQTSLKQQLSGGERRQMQPVVLCSIAGGSHFLTRSIPAPGYTAGLLAWGMEGLQGSPSPF